MHTLVCSAKKKNKTTHMSQHRYISNYMGLLILGLLSIVNTTLLHNPQLVKSVEVEPQRNCRYGAPTVKLCVDFLTEWRVSAPNALIVQGSTELSKRSQPQRLHLHVFLEQEKLKAGQWLSRAKGGKRLTGKRHKDTVKQCKGSYGLYLSMWV